MKLDLVTIEQSSNKDILKKPAETVIFPLNAEILDLIDALQEKLIEVNAAGLAASQVGYPVRVIVYHVPPEALIIRQDAKEVVPLTVLLNPSYVPIKEEGKFLDWEGCFSVSERMGKVPRYKCIHYEGITPEGKKVSAKAWGFLSRLLQHEIDHTNGTLITEVLTPDCLQGHPNEMMPLRKKEMEERIALKEK
jgi:peptide deformylase